MRQGGCTATVPTTAAAVAATAKRHVAAATAAKGAAATAVVTNVIAATAATAAATPEAAATPVAVDTTATVRDIVSRRQEDGKHDRTRSLWRCPKGSHARWYNRSAATAAATVGEQTGKGERTPASSTARCWRKRWTELERGWGRFSSFCTGLVEPGGVCPPPPL